MQLFAISFPRVANNAPDQIPSAIEVVPGHSLSASFDEIRIFLL